MPHLSVDNGKVELYYEVYGEGQIKVLFVQGFATTFRSWCKQIEFFTEMKHYQICLLDNRGVGSSSAPTGAYTTSQMALDALEVVDRALGWKHFHLVGLSMGGMISLEMSFMLLDRLLSLTLLSTHAGGTIPPWSGLLRIAQNYRPSLSADKYVEFLIPVLYSKEWLQEFYVDENGVQSPKFRNYDIVKQELIDARNEDPPEKFVGLVGQALAIMGHYISGERLRKLRDSKIAILIMTGTKDHLIKPSNSFAMKKLLNPEQFVVLEGAGHMIHRERYEQVNKALHDHFQLHNNRLKSAY